MIAVNIRNDDDIRCLHPFKCFRAAIRVGVNCFALPGQGHCCVIQRLNRERAFGCFYFICCWSLGKTNGKAQQHEAKDGSGFHRGRFYYVKDNRLKLCSKWTLLEHNKYKDITLPLGEIREILFNNSRIFFKLVNGLNVRMKHVPIRKLLCGSVVCLLVTGCWSEDNRQALSKAGQYAFEQTDTNSYPMLIDDGSRIVYRFGHMTPDKGLNLYLDTIANPKGGLLQD